MKIKLKLHSIFFINILLAVVVGFTAYFFLKKIIFHQVESGIKYLDKAFINLEHNDSRTLASSLELFTNDHSFQKIFMEKDREQLYSYCKPLFETMEKQYGITHFYFILPNGKCFLRVHNKNIYGDNITRSTFRKAKETQSIISGIELGKTAFALRTVMPYYYKNKLIGYVEFGEEIDHFLKILEDETPNTTLALVVNKKYLDSEKFKSVKEVAERRNNWDDLKDYVIINDISESKVLKDHISVLEINRIKQGESLLNEFDFNNSSYALGGFTIKGVDNADIGVVLVLQNVDTSSAFLNRYMTIFVIIIILAILITIVSGLVISHSITNPIIKIAKSLSSMSKGKLESNIEFKSKNEIGILASSYNTVVEMLRDVSSAANNVANGNTDVEIKLKSEDDILAQSFNEMTRKLREQEIFNKERFWTSTAIEKLSIILRNEKKTKKLGEKICSFLAELLGVQTVTLFLLDQTQLSLTGSYALERGNKINDVLEIGEGLVGQAVIEKKILSVTDIPEDYKRINWSQGSALPSNIVFLPFIFNDEVIGVIEFGALKEISELKLEFLKLISEPIAIGFFNLNQSSKLQNLLEQTQSQAEELQTQQEELRSSNEELTNQTEELQVSQDRLQAQQEELRATNEELEEKTETLKEQKTDIKERNNKLNEIRIELEEKSRNLSLSTKYKSEFLANMSHELRTPLNSLLLLSKKFTKNKDENLTEKQVKNAEIIYNSGCDLLNMINDILDLSKIEAGKMTLVVEEVKLVNFKNIINDNFGHIMESKGLDFSIDIDSNLPASINTDSQKLNQVIKNLLSNAVKFTKQGSIKVKIFKPQRKIDFQNPKLKSANSVAISVTDTGLGISKDKKQLIFEAFQQADGTTSREFGGTGLGLSISRELAKLLEGEIQIESTVGAGSMFTLFINADLNQKTLKENNKKIELSKNPESPKDAVAELKEEAVSYPSLEDDREALTANDKVILIVEDDLNFAQVLYDSCKEKNFKCIQCSDGKSALALTFEYIPTAIILDVRLLGEFNGLQVLDELKENLKTRHIPVHVISVDDLRVDTLTKGAIGFLQKPILEADIDEMLKSLTSVSTEPKNILIIEDDEKNCHSIQETLSIENLIFSVANTGKDGIEKLSSKKYSLVILDLTLPDISGFEIMKTIKSQYENLPIIVYTGRDLDDKEKRLIAKYSASTILKNAQSTERLLDEVSLFLHTNVNNLSKGNKKIINDYHSVESSLAGKTVLIVDDDMRNLYLLEEELRDINMNVVKAINGKMAVDLLIKNKKIDIVLMDIMMPVMNGYEAIKKIRKTPKISSVPIIAVTAKAMKEDREKCIDAGADDYITKPVDIDKLTTLMRVWANK